MYKATTSARSPFLKKITPQVEAVCKKQTVHVMRRADALYQQLLAENHAETKAVRMHTKARIYPAIAVFQALLEVGLARADAAEVIHRYYVVHSEKKAALLRRTLKFLGLYKIIPRLAYQITKRGFGKDAGFQAHFIKTSREVLRFDMLCCPYFETCKRYEAEEIVGSFCDADDICYGSMHPRIQWLRTKTLGHGGDCCDFHIKLAAKS